MWTERVPATDAAIDRAVGLLAAGGLVAFPTETVYGLGARADHAAAVERLYEVKGRPASVPLLVHVPSAEAARPFAADWPAAAAALARAFWPGSVSLVVRRTQAVLDVVTAGGETVALRVPSHPVARRLLEACPFALVAPSANRFGEPPPRSAVEVVHGLGGRIPLVLDAGEVGSGPPDERLSSTIVDVTCEPPVLLRPGAVARRAIEAIVALR